MHENPVARMEVAHCASGFSDNPDRLMAQHEWGLAADVPGHNIAGTDAASCNADQQVLRARLGAGSLLQADITEIVKASYLHWHEKTLRSYQLACQSD